MGTRTIATKHTLEELYTLKWNKPVTMRDILKELYMNQNKTILEISKELRVSQGTVSAWLKQHGIPARGWNFPNKIKEE